MEDMPDKGYRTITVTESVYEKIKTKAEQEKKSIATFATQILASYMEADEKLSRYAPYIEVIGFEGNSAILRDHKTGDIIDVRLYDKELHCVKDEAKDCVHAAFCLALPQVRKVVRG